MYFLRILLVSAFFFLPFFSFAQVSTTTAQEPSSLLQQQIDQLMQSRINMIPELSDVRKGAIEGYLDVQISPNNPAPNEQINIKVVSYLSDLNKATITWTLNDRVVVRGIGKTSFGFKNGQPGKTTRLTLTITTNTDEEIVKEFSWTPVGLTILWQADTYVPPFYRGKALASPQSKVKAVAIPESGTGSKNALDAGNLVYVWEKDGAVIPDASGYGKNAFIFTAPKPYEETNIKVRASSVDDTMNSESRIYLSITNPFIVFYEKDPLLGTVYNRPIGSTFSLSKKEFSISAEPFYFSSERGDAPTFIYDWRVDGNKSQNYGRSITLRNQSGEAGTSIVSLAMRGLTQSFQIADRSLRVNFAENKESESTRPVF